MSKAEEKQEMIHVLRHEPAYRETFELNCPEGVLLMAILDRAIRDALMPDRLLNKHIPKAICPAHDWLYLSGSFKMTARPLPFTFQWVCEMLSIDPIRLRHNLLKLIASGKSDAVYKKNLCTSFRKVTNGFNNKIRNRGLEKLVA